MDGPLRRTALGNLALHSREVGKRLPARLRGLLLQVDGERTAEALQALAVSLGMPEDSVDELAERQLIEPVHKPTAAVPAASPVHTPAEPGDAPVSERDALLASLSELVGEVSAALPAALVETDVVDMTAQPVLELPPKLQTVRDKMLGVATMVAGQPGRGLRQQLSDCHDISSLHMAFGALRLALKKGYKGDEADRILDPIKKMLPPMPVPAG